MAENDYGLPEEITPQSVFDKVALHLLRQGKPSRTDKIVSLPDSICRYRGQDGSACAVGCMISDEDYNPAYEGQAIEILLTSRVYDYAGHRAPNPFPESMRVGPIAEMLKDLQVIHDHASLDDDGRFVKQSLCGHLARVAQRFGISEDRVWDFVVEEAS